MQCKLSTPFHILTATAESCNFHDSEGEQLCCGDQGSPSGGLDRMNWYLSGISNVPGLGKYVYVVALDCWM